MYKTNEHEILRQDARNKINSLMSAELSPAKKKGTYICPLCGNGSGIDGDGISSRDGGRHWKCFKCQFYGDYLDYLKELHNCSERNIFDMYGICVQKDKFPYTRSSMRLKPIDKNITSAVPSIFENVPEYLPSSSFCLYLYNGKNNLYNTSYSKRVTIDNLAKFTKAMNFDHVCCRYKGYTRKNANFLHSNCIMMDIDNDSEDPLSWKFPRDLKVIFPGVPYYVSYSKSHMKEKNGLSARPRFHVYFPISKITDEKIYAYIKKLLCSVFPAFDKSASDSSRFFAGIDNPITEFIPGNKNLLYLLSNS